MPTSTRRRACAAVLLLLCAACSRDPIAWSDADDRRVALPAPSAAAPGDPAADLDTVRRLVRAAVDLPPDVATAPVDPAAGRACPGSLAIARGAGAALAAVWWEPRGDGTASLMSTRSPDAGQTWGRPVPVDTLDRGSGGCQRPAPSIALDSAYLWTHIAYSMTAPEGKGVFYAHRMHADGPFEPPIVIVYGDRPALTSITSRAETVLVAYEDPNVGERTRVSLAVSRAGGHTFDERLLVSGTGSAAERPQVALRAGGTVAIGWIEKVIPRLDDPSRTRAETAAGSRSVIVRVGTLR